MQHPTITPKRKPAAGTIRGGLDFVRTTTRLISGKDNRHEFIRLGRARRKVR